MQRRLLRLAPDAFDDRGAGALALAEIYWLHGDTAHARVYADTARRVLTKQVEAGTNDELQFLALGLAYAFLGNRRLAITRGEDGVARVPRHGRRCGATRDLRR